MRTLQTWTDYTAAPDFKTGAAIFPPGAVTDRRAYRACLPWLGDGPRSCRAWSSITERADCALPEIDIDLFCRRPPEEM